MKFFENQTESASVATGKKQKNVHCRPEPTRVTTCLTKLKGGFGWKRPQSGQEGEGYSGLRNGEGGRPGSPRAAKNTNNSPLGKGPRVGGKTENLEP